MQPILIQGGRVIDPATGRDQIADVLLDEGLIRQVETHPGRLGAQGQVQRIDADQCIVAPGLIDVHVHFREPDPRHRETIRTGSASAVAGGFTTVCCMPNTNPPLDSATRVRQTLQQGRAAGGARVLTSGCATEGRAGQTMAPIAEMSAAGAVAFTDDGACVADASVMTRVLRAITALGPAGPCFMQHCQDPALTEGGVMNAGSLALRMGLGGWPAEAEQVVIDRDLRLNRSIGCRYHAQHVSSGGSVDFIRKARAEGQPVTAEVSPHHLLLTEEACAGYDTAAKVNPPLRTQADIDQLKAAVAECVITILATDHAPHPAETKDTDFASAAFGIVGLETALPLYAKALIEDGVLDWPELLAMMTIAPARLLGIDRQGFGTLAVEGPADVTIIDPHRRWTIDASEFASTGRNCPFNRWTVTGQAIGTIVAGEIRRAPGDGRLAAATAATGSRGSSGG